MHLYLKDNAATMNRKTLPSEEMMTPVKAPSSEMINPMTPVMIGKIKVPKISRHLSFSEIDAFCIVNAIRINQLYDGDDGSDKYPIPLTEHLIFSEFDDFYYANAPHINRLCDGDDGKAKTTAAASSGKLVDTDDEKVCTRAKSGKRLKNKAKD